MIKKSPPAVDLSSLELAYNKQLANLNWVGKSGVPGYLSDQSNTKVKYGSSSNQYFKLFTTVIKRIQIAQPMGLFLATAKLRLWNPRKRDYQLCLTSRMKMKYHYHF